MSVRPSVRPYGVIRFLLDGFSLNLKFQFFRKSVEKIQVSLKSARITRILYEDVFTFMTISC